MNRLYFGDNLKWLSDRNEFPNASVDLVYLYAGVVCDGCFFVFLRSKEAIGTLNPPAPVANDIRAGVAEPSNKSDDIIVPDHTLISVGCGSREEAHFVCALLNSAPANFIVRSYVALHPSPHILNHIRVPRFDPNKTLHIQLAESSEACHAATAAGDDSALESLEAANNLLAAELWELSDAELKEIQRSLADLT